MKTRNLILVRHGQSEWNEQNLFTGWKNPPLTEKGIKEAENAGKKIKSLQIIFSHYFTSALIRAQETGEIILNTLQQKDLIKVKDQNLNESIKISIRFLTNEIRTDSLDIKVFNKKCNNTLNCKITESDGVISKELKRKILKTATLYKEEKNKKK